MHLKLKRMVISLGPLLGCLMVWGCATRVTPVTVGRQAVFYGVRKTATERVKLAHAVDSRITSIQNHVWDSCRSLFSRESLASPSEVMHPYNSLNSKQKASTSLSRADLIYRDAIALFENRDYLLALQKFRLVVTLYPSHPLADNALFWAGECCYLKGWLGEAHHFFSRVIREYPMGNEIPNTMVKLALIDLYTGKVKKGKEMLEKVVTNYPNSEASKEARKRLLELKTSKKVLSEQWESSTFNPSVFERTSSWD